MRHASPPRRRLMLLSGLLTPEIAVVEKIFRAAAIYGFLLLAFRLTGKRQIGQLTPFDLVVLLVISNIVQNAMIGNDNSLGGGLIGATTILVLNWGVVEVTFRFKRVRRLLEARPTVLIHDGRILHDRLKAERITMDDLEAALRRGGIADPTRVRFAVLEESGGISVVPYSEGGSRPPSDAPRA
jgi:uncharacterized membrane protein YcaP (DUF421 family)